MPTRRKTVFSKTAASAVGAFMMASAVAAITGAPALAHHAAPTVLFAPDKEVVLTGTVKEFRFSNPHASINLTVTQPGDPAEWRIFTEAPNDLEKAGMDQTSLRPGERVNG
jgi:hypothetical protein